MQDPDNSPSNEQAADKSPFPSAFDPTQLKSFGPHTLLIGILLVILGTIGIIVPGAMSFATLGFISGLAILGGALWAYHAYKAHATGFMDWFKPLILLVFGVLLLIYPIPGVASLALLLAMYLLMDAYSSFALAHSRYPDKGWGWMTFNGIMDIGLAALFLIGWPEYSMLLVGIFVAVSLIFDGWALVVIGWAMRKAGSDSGRKAA